MMSHLTNPEHLSHHAIFLKEVFGNGTKRRCEASEPKAGQRCQPAPSADSQLIAVPSPDTALTVLRLSTFSRGTKVIPQNVSGLLNV